MDSPDVSLDVAASGLGKPAASPTRDFTSPIQRYAAAYDRLQRKRRLAIEETQRAEQERVRQQHAKLHAQLQDFIPPEVLWDWQVHFLEQGYETPEIKLVPWFAIGSFVRVRIGLGWLHGREAIEVLPATPLQFGQCGTVLEKGMPRELVEEVLAAALFTDRGASTEGTLES